MYFTLLYGFIYFWMCCGLLYQFVVSFFRNSCVYISYILLILDFRQQNLQGKIIKLWCSITAAICLWDFITVVIFGSEYAKCLDYYQSFNLGFEDVVILEAACASGTLIPLVIAAKGFILWIINIVCIVLVYQIAKQTNVRQNTISLILLQ